MSVVLSCRGVSVSYGGVRALVDVDLDVAEGQLVGLIGPNGAGKTTFIDAITGIVRSRGRTELDGEDLTSLPSHARARRGLTRTWQSIELFDDLTVLENLTVLIPRHSRSAPLVSVGASPKVAAAEAALERFGLESLADAMPSEVSQAQRKLVGLARALAADPRVLCLDEPAAGLDVTESEELGRHLRQIVDGGIPVLLVDHDMGLVLGISDHVVVLEFGQVIATGDPEAVRRDPQVVTAYLGKAAAEVEGATA
jgi:branched-chain amino acid transport system ATP-binding protein